MRDSLSFLSRRRYERELNMWYAIRQPYVDALFKNQSSSELIYNLSDICPDEKSDAEQSYEYTWGHNESFILNDVDTSSRKESLQKGKSSVEQSYKYTWRYNDDDDVFNDQGTSRIEGFKYRSNEERGIDGKERKCIPCKNHFEEEIKKSPVKTFTVGGYNSNLINENEEDTENTDKTNYYQHVQSHTSNLYEGREVRLSKQKKIHEVDIKAEKTNAGGRKMRPTPGGIHILRLTKTDSQEAALSFDCFKKNSNELLCSCRSDTVQQVASEQTTPQQELKIENINVAAHLRPEVEDEVIGSTKDTMIDNGRFVNSKENLDPKGLDIVDKDYQNNLLESDLMINIPRPIGNAHEFPLQSVHESNELSIDNFNPNLTEPCAKDIRNTSTHDIKVVVFNL